MQSWLACELELDDGRIARFGPDEAEAGDLPSDIQFATQNPGGFGDGSFVIRRPEWATREALLFSPARIYGPGGRTFYEGRCKDVSQVDRDSIRLDLEGWAAHLDDDESFHQLYVSRDLGRWTEASYTRRLGLLGIFNSVYASSSEMDGSTPALTITLPATEVNPSGEAWFDAGAGETISSIYYDFASVIDSATYSGTIGVASNDAAGAEQNSADLITSTPNPSGSGTFTPTVAYRFAKLLFHLIGTVSARDRSWSIRRLAVFGDHELPKAGSAPDEGYLGSQILAHAIGQGAPLLSVDTESVEQSTHVFDDLWHESGVVRELVERITAFGGAANELNDWGVYENRRFFWRTPGTHGKVWRVRRDQVAVPTEDGPAAAARFAGVVIAYRDAAGTTKTVGPLQSGADFETALLSDSNDNNPARKVPNRIVRRDVGITYQEGAVRLGQALLAEQNAGLRRGNVTLVGTVTDEGGAEHPAAAVRACDRVIVEDEAGVSPDVQYVNSTSYEHSSATVTANLGYAPHKVDLVLTRLAAAIQSRGLS